jgi:hypothetical protein
MVPRKTQPVNKVKEPMKLFSVRFDTAEREALENAAKADDRPAAVLLRRIARDWLKSNGYLK